MSPPWLTGQLERGKRWEIQKIRFGSIWKSSQVGVVSTARLTHATPGAMYSHSPMRDWEADVNLPTDSVGCADIATQVRANRSNIFIRPYMSIHVHTKAYMCIHVQLIESMEGGKVVVALGGGRRNFQTVENGGRRMLKDLVNRFAS